MGEQVVEFGEEEGDRPEGAITHFFLEVRGVAAPELVVHDNWDSVGVPEILDGEEVVVWHSWSAVKTDEGSYAGVESPEYGVPCFAGLAGSWRVEVDFGFKSWDCHCEYGLGMKGGWQEEIQREKKIHDVRGS